MYNAYFFNCKNYLWKDNAMSILTFYVSFITLAVFLSPLINSCHTLAVFLTLSLFHAHFLLVGPHNISSLKSTTCRKNYTVFIMEPRHLSTIPLQNSHLFNIAESIYDKKILNAWWKSFSETMDKWRSHVENIISGKDLLQTKL